MGNTITQRDAILVTGWGRSTRGIIACLRQAGHPVTVYAGNGFETAECAPVSPQTLNIKELDRSVKVADRLEDVGDFNLVIACTDENEFQKRALIRQLEVVLAPDALIGINTESIPLSSLQRDALHPGRIVGVNWTEPADMTFFLEIIANDTTDRRLVNDLNTKAGLRWQKDPYVVYSDLGIRTRMLCAMIREAFFLLENGYVSVEDIDRACRNDPGYYLPFSGHFRYMDLMGAFIYGVVMQDLFPELAKSRHIPRFFEELVQQGGLGMVTRKGFYDYDQSETGRWEESFREFSQQIRLLISKYPFNYEETPEPAAKQPVVYE
ncbi:3-hydroxyacyl-CoA dehydrogenase family protein [Larkinella soli]|uniref:3-hydroxyacyl-CoA dehydrogenase family protein n=1 Tax=Larkinella soli TaxID=1770527 RepID=UPI000FFB3E46|nr:3-hydroxyacyl-CoA dehydrogenase NAD-binding domain-containing protein [Larkinella soli]